MVPGENPSGKRKQQGSISKAGNAHLRQIVVEAAWSYRLRSGVGPALRKRQQGVPEEIKEIAWKAQVRLSNRYALLVAAGKDQRKIVTTVGRELLGFIWAIGVKAETRVNQQASQRIGLFQNKCDLLRLPLLSGLLDLLFGMKLLQEPPRRFRRWDLMAQHLFQPGIVAKMLEVVLCPIGSEMKMKMDAFCKRR